MVLSTFQRDRIKHHLDVPTGQPINTAIIADRALLFDALTVEDELQIVGDLTTNPADPTHKVVAGQLLAAEGSVLFYVEQAYELMNPTNIDPSLFVATVGTIRLRSNELAKRKQIYEHWRDRLALLLNFRVQGASDAVFDVSSQGLSLY
jgi:hypothetical protein